MIKRILKNRNHLDSINFVQVLANLVQFFFVLNFKGQM